MPDILFSSTAEQLDQHFGFRINDIERDLLDRARVLRPNGTVANFGHVLHEGHQTWVGLDPQTLNTPYSELAQLCYLLGPKNNELMIDLGAGYGRLGVVLNRFYPLVNFKGYELVEERVNEGNRVFRELAITSAQLFTQDLTSEEFTLPLAQYYFLYDYGREAHIRNTLKQLEVYADTNHFKVIARGKGSRSIIEHEHPWLSQINPVHHEENFSIYSF